MNRAVAEACAGVTALSASSIIDGSVVHHDKSVVRINRAMMQAAGRRALLVTHVKFAIRAPNHFAELAEFDRVFVDDRLDAATVARFTEAGIPLDLVLTEKDRTCRP